MRSIVGVILAGGKASRMAGADKPLLELDGKPLIAHVAERLQSQVGPLVISANGDTTRFGFLRLPVIADSLTGQPGPLAGLLAAMDYAQARGASHIVSCAADTPFLPLDLVARLAGSGKPLALAASAERVHGVTGLWPLTLRAPIAEALERGERAVYRFALRFEPAIVSWASTPIDPFFNINTPADLEAARLMSPSPAR